MIKVDCGRRLKYGYLSSGRIVSNVLSNESELRTRFGAGYLKISMQMMKNWIRSYCNACVFFFSFFSLSVNNFCGRKSRSSRKLFFWNSLLVFRWYGWCIEKVVFSLISFLNNVGKPEENVGYRRSCTFFRLKTIVNTWIILNRSEMYGPGVPHLPASLPPRNELFFQRTTSK